MEHKAQREPLVVDELADAPSPAQYRQLHSGRGFGKRARQQAAGALLRVERPVAPSSRSKPATQPVSYPRASAGLVVWRGVPSWFQKREPNGAAAQWKATQSPPWVRKRRARAKTRFAKASRRANRG